MNERASMEPSLTTEPENSTLLASPEPLATTSNMTETL
jgi:hypothetical protein